MPGAGVEYALLTRRGQIRRLRQAAARALPQYGIEPGSLSLLQHRYNTTFIVGGHEGARYVLHILRPSDDGRSESQNRSRVESELWWQDRVRTDLAFPVPVTVRTPGGDGVVTAAVDGMAAPSLCTLLHWMDGHRLLHRLTPAHVEAVGRVTAQLHNHSVHLRVPTWFDRTRVDRADAESEDEVVALFTDHVSEAAAAVMGSVLQQVRKTQQGLANGPETFGVIHADIHQKNYLFRGRDVRLIDFGDCGWGHYLYDLAVTVSELAVLPNGVGLREALISGYRRRRDLSSAHEALIDTFVMLREVQNLTWLVRARDDPSYAGRAAQIGDRVSALERRLRAGI